MTTNDELAAAQADIAKLQAENYRLRGSRSNLDCRYTNGNVADIGGSHCDDRPCDRCRYERRIEELRRIQRAAEVYVLTRSQGHFQVSGLAFRELCEVLGKDSGAASQFNQDLMHLTLAKIPGVVKALDAILDLLLRARIVRPEDRVMPDPTDEVAIYAKRFDFDRMLRAVAPFQPK